MTEPSPHGSPWWRGAVVYQIYPRSFRGTTESGYGTIAGITSQLGYLAQLGIDAIWLSPMYPSPGVDGGYDVADYCNVDPLLGTLADMEALVGRAHELGLRVLLDWVANHTSDQHSWFESSRRNPEGPHGDWYWWADEIPNNWISAFNGPAWTFDEVRQQYYLHLFAPEQPDLNWNVPAVRSAMLAGLRFWLDRGIDGFRADVVHLIGRDPALASLPHLSPADGSTPGRDDLVHNYLDPNTHEHLREIRALLDSYPGDRVMIGEVALGDHHAQRVPDYLGTADQPELGMTFEFSLMSAAWDANDWCDRIRASLRLNRPRPEQPRGTVSAWVLGNHDAPRLRSRLGGSEARARLAATLLLTLPGTPFLYQGDEWGLLDAVVPPERVVDMIGRDVARAPLPWDDGPRHGWPVPDPWLPWPPEVDSRNRSAQQRDSASILGLTRRLLALRRDRPALARGRLDRLVTVGQVMLFRRTADDGQDLLVVANFGEYDVDFADLSEALHGLHVGDAVAATSPEVGPGPLACVPGESAVIVACGESV